MMFMSARKDENYRGPKITAHPPYVAAEYKQVGESPPQIFYQGSSCSY
jgi:hypothetical protein